MVVILNKLQSDELRYKYIQNFVNTASNYYIENIKRKTRFRDGLCYTGYLWDCLINPQSISKNKADQILQDKRKLFIMWDIHSCERILIPNYWKYPKVSILYTNKWSNTLKVNLPEDVYIFDNTFYWSVIYTHETNIKENQYCIYLDNGPRNTPKKFAFE